MKKLSELLKSKIRPVYAIIAVVLIMLSTLVVSVCAQYYKSLQDTIRVESSSYLLELSSQIGINVKKIVNSNFSMLKTVDMLLGNVETTSLQKVQDLMEQQRENWNYRDLMLIDQQGNMHDSSGKIVYLEEGSYLREVVVNRTPSISPCQMINNEECILFTVPVDGLEIEGVQFSALGATFLLDTFDQVLSTAAFDGQAYTLIINQDGTTAVPSSSESADPIGYNVLSYLENTAPEQSVDFLQMRNNILASQSGQFETAINGVRKYVVYHPIETQGWSLVTFVPVHVVNAKSELLLQITLWFCAFITLLVSVLVLLLTVTFFRHKRKLEQIAFVDPVTGGHTMQRFYLSVEEAFQKSNRPSYAIIYTNIEKFRLINEQYGRESGDGMLREMESAINENLVCDECAGHAMADHFVVLVEYENEELLAIRFQDWYNAISVRMASHGIDLVCPPIQFGVYAVSVYTMPIPLMMDRAKFALRDLTNVLNNRVRYAIYDEKAHQRLFREKQLEDKMEKSLENHEFVAFLQPKYITDFETVGGAEALVRWISPDEGMIYPDEFIPLFERNGFIVQLDLWIFEEVCRTIRKWIDQGLEPVKVSVNCSRIHFDKLDFLTPYRKIFEKYDFPAKYIDLEVTESIVYENMERLSEIIERIHEIGFTCSIDDFGSGYSSLNMIQDIQADTLKLDKIFFRNPRNESRAQSVVESIVGMAKSLSMTTVAEGVEHRSQVNMLKEVGCDYIQGYVFAKPMPIADFEKLTFGKQTAETK